MEVTDSVNIPPSTNTCFLCTQNFAEDPAASTPRSLCCAHTLCEGCLTFQWNKNDDNLFQIVCPQCGILTTHPSLDGFPVQRERLAIAPRVVDEPMEETPLPITVVEVQTTVVEKVKCEGCPAIDEIDRMRVCMEKKCDQYLQALCLMCCVDYHSSHKKTKFVAPDENVTRIKRGAYKTYDISNFPDKRILDVRGHEITVSASYLSSYSSFFRDLFYCPDNRSKEKLPLDCDPELFEDLLDMIYPCRKDPVCCHACVSSLPSRLSLTLHLNFSNLVDPLLEEFQKFYTISDLHSILSESDEMFERFVLSTSDCYDEIHEGFGLVEIDKMEDGGQKLEYEHVRGRFIEKSDKRKEVVRSLINLHFPDVRILQIGTTSLVVSASFLSLHSPFYRQFFYSSHASQEREIKWNFFDAPSFLNLSSIFMDRIPKVLTKRLMNLLGRVQCMNYVERYREKLMKEWRKSNEADCPSSLIDLPEATLALIKYYDCGKLTKKTIASLVRWMNRGEVNRMVGWIDEEAVKRIEKREKEMEKKKEEKKDERLERKRERRYEELCEENDYYDMEMDDVDVSDVSDEEESKEDVKIRKKEEKIEEYMRILARRILIAHRENKGNEKEKISLIVKNGDSSHSLTLPPSAFIEDIKRKLDSIVKRPYQAIHLIMQNQSMKNDQSLVDYGIVNGSQIEMRPNDENCY
ncbi:hypothetical protein PFISCL1PPCAC_5984 [Pristionchus fissidentatus]|uniref:RING-type domain-containing protein n=1 Tax=Pristionchus fissidentatus TaxID=1538716 RepID=A0AAV5V7H2_9BILA|nr:hypothetical protein PFISCL1PPCAC_5984 [Pristionchus fissidentatus]